ncbi:MAG TPA: LCP family protein [Anaerolineales bacterium]|nr:LCP family protein [Anaerolineales bacterium]
MMNKIKNIKRPSMGQIGFFVIAIALAIGGFYFVRGIVTCWSATALPGSRPSYCGATISGLAGPELDEQGTPVAVIEDELPPPPPIAVPDADLPPEWDGASRINILFLGLDERDWVEGLGAPRSDTMILFTVDPLSKTAGMISIPRDLWVNIPGFGYSRINTAYSSGEGSKLPGGGPGLAMKTVEQFLGVPIQYYAQVDFGAFEEAIDAMGGLEMCVAEPLQVSVIGKENKQLFRAGCRVHPGYMVLAYARTRKTEGGDIDRAERQQQVILALRDQIFDPENFPHMVSIAPDVYAEASAGLRTNMIFEDALKLGTLMSQIPVESIKRGIIDYTMGGLDNVTLGGENASVMKPFPDKIRELRDQIFTAGGPLSPLAQGDPTALMQADNSRVRILNGSITPGLEVNTGNYFLNQGLPVTEVGPADRAYDRTIIYLYSPKLYTLKYLQTVFGITSPTQIRIEADPASTVDIEVRLGNDWANSNPMP